MNPDAPLRTVAPLEDVIAGSLGRRRFALELLGMFALLAAALTAVGVYGVVTYTLSQRRHEFAIRRALGALGWELAALIIRWFAVPMLVGLVTGGLLTAMFRGVLRAYLYKLSPADPVTLAAVVCVLLVLIVLAALWPLVSAAGISAAAIPRE